MSIWIIGQDLPEVGRVYAERRAKGATQWCSDVNLAQPFRSKPAADQHIKDYHLEGAFCIVGRLILEKPPTKVEKFEPIAGWTGLHRPFLGPNSLVLYVGQTNVSRGTSKRALNKSTFEHFQRVAKLQGLRYQVFFEIDRKRGTVHDFNLSNIQHLSVRYGPSGPYYLISDLLLETTAA